MKRVISILIILVCIISISCRKRKERTIQPSRDYALIANSTTTIPGLLIGLSQEDRILEIIEEGMDTTNTCAQLIYVSGDTANFPGGGSIRFDLDYGTGCIDGDGIYKEGVINCRLYNYLDYNGGKLTCSFDEFYFGGNELSGSLTVTYLGNEEYHVNTTNISLLVGNKVVYLDADLTLNRIEGEGTLEEVMDDAYSIDDLSFITDRYGNEESVTAEGLYKLLGCRWISAGVVELENDDSEVQVIDFGNKDCNNEATVTIEDKVYVIDLP